ncbi:MAG: hypothetical protein ACYTG0_46325, partial [Planctomycetota bacterium]
LAADKKGNVYLLFERGKKKLYESIAIARFNLAWLTKGQEPKKTAKGKRGQLIMSLRLTHEP